MIEGPSTQRGEYSLSSLARHCKEMFVAPPGHIFVARDFSGIEAVLVGWLAGSSKYTRLAKLGVHDYFMAHGILRPAGMIADADLPDLRWSDDDLRACFRSLKARFPSERDVAKRVVHLSNYAGTPAKIFEEYPETFTTKQEASRRQGAYFALFPEIPQWHERLTVQVDQTGYVRAPSGFVMRFFRVRDWSKVDGRWVSKLGDSGKALIASVPQHMAAFIGREVLKRLWGGTPIGPYLRLFIHDEILCECPVALADVVDQRLQAEMEQPIPQLPLDPGWGMGNHLSIGSAGKRGISWGDMH